MLKFSLNVFIGIVLTISSTSILAHSFNLGLLIPQSESGQQALDGFLLATTEEDVHPDETSDGHLGGLDSHVLKIDSGADPMDMLKNLEDLLQSRQPIFVTGLFTPDTARLVSKAAKQGNAVLFDPTESLMWQKAVSSPDSQKLIDGGSFSARFEKRYDYSPTLDSLRGYIAARLIAATVRSLSEEDLYDVDVLSSAFKQIAK